MDNNKLSKQELLEKIKEDQCSLSLLESKYPEVKQEHVKELVDHLRHLSFVDHYKTVYMNCYQVVEKKNHFLQKGEKFISFVKDAEDKVAEYDRKEKEAWDFIDRIDFRKHTTRFDKFYSPSLQIMRMENLIEQIAQYKTQLKKLKNKSISK